MFPSKIISGGQTGADQAGLDFAIARAIEHGGWCPRNRRCDAGQVPSRFQLRETEQWSYVERTQRNVREADATVIFARERPLSPGCALTLKTCRDAGKPSLVVILPPEVLGLPEGSLGRIEAVSAKGRALALFLAASRPAVLNVAGNREGTSPGIGDLVRAVLGSAWDQVAAMTAEDLAAGVAPPPAPPQLEFNGLVPTIRENAAASGRQSR